ncbi:RpiB/LacA/LacB family sugar-phosphate isomerase [Patescibacteria group bacterium]|nr:RpiB/LacA/LacB family sugar-phosphate isomerase [Patescibacteria group bacterium]MBP9710040.1 RpiB/LacA/LacB family sugar-phosphate isomerase [Patescibacteria group bacterium]
MKKMYIASDHRGIGLKDALLPFLNEQSFEVVDVTPTKNADGSIDFPLASQAVAQHVVQEGAQGLILCGSGIGVAIAANRFKGIRAATAHTPEEIHEAKEHNHINVLCLGADETSKENAEALISAWIEAKPDTAERRLRRLAQLDTYGS